MIKKKFTGVILAAGKGSRMEPFSSQYPKPLLPICNKAQILYQFEILKNVGIREIIIVIGHLGYEIVRYISKADIKDINVRYVEQEEPLGIAHAVGKLERYISTPFLMFLGDIFFDPIDLEQIFDPYIHEDAGAVLAVKYEDNPDAIKKNFTIKLNEKNNVSRVIEKPRYIQNNLKGCGLYFFDLPIFDAIRSTPRTAMRNEYEITHSIQILIDDGINVKVKPVVKYDMNITFPYDLLTCNLYQLKQLGIDHCVGENTVIHPECKIFNSVIGNGVEIREPIEIRNSVIFENTIIKKKKNLDFIIHTPNQLVDCKFHLQNESFDEALF